MALHANNFLTWVPVKRTYVNSSGTWTRLKVHWVNNSGTWTALHAYGMSGSVTGAVYANSITGFANYIGYNSISGSGTQGSVSPSNAMTSGIGMTLVEFSSAQDGSGSRVSVAGFSSNPGASWLLAAGTSSVFANASSATFLYTGVIGTATWTFTGVNFAITNGGTKQIAVVVT